MLLSAPQLATWDPVIPKTDPKIQHSKHDAMIGIRSIRDNQKKYYDHRVKDLEEFEPGQVVWITDKTTYIAYKGSYGRIKANHAASLSDLIENPRDIIRRNLSIFEHLLDYWNMIKIIQRENCQISQEAPHLFHFQMICQDLQACPTLLHQRRQHLVQRGLLSSFIKQGVIGQCDLRTDLIYNLGEV
ncbi:hypothetical protein AVEN_16286-1 [Araneus ventricosus]|uniref:Uncharacterized protein n=1 Tax=Araneus ventricosus TaxID=182803 RepID=A0A4Y2LTE6_ARAVE|nr:hypothetical protein AVEN_16286-1 [Araneus ventricosus]